MYRRLSPSPNARSSIGSSARARRSPASTIAGNAIGFDPPLPGDILRVTVPEGEAGGAEG